MHAVKDLVISQAEMFDKTFYVDEIYGRRLTIDTDYKAGTGGFYNATGDPQNNPNVIASLCWDGVEIATGPGTLDPRYYSILTLTANHPYAAAGGNGPPDGTYMDATVEKRIIVVLGLTIVHGWGDTGSALLSKWAEEGEDAALPLR